MTRRTRACAYRARTNTVFLSGPGKVVVHDFFDVVLGLHNSQGTQVSSPSAVFRESSVHGGGESEFPLNWVDMRNIPVPGLCSIRVSLLKPSAAEQGMVSRTRQRHIVFVGLDSEADVITIQERHDSCHIVIGNQIIVINK